MNHETPGASRSAAVQPNDDLESRRAGRILAFVLLAAVGVRAIHFALTLHVPALKDLFILDSRVYDEMANQMLAHGLMGGDEVFAHAPLYPWLLAILRSISLADTAFVIALQQILGVASVALTAWIARRCFGVRASLAAASLFAFYGAGAMLESKLMASTLGVFLALASLVSLLEAKRRRSPLIAGLSGLLLAGTCLARPNTLLFVPLAAAWLLWPAGQPGARKGSAWIAASIRSGCFVLGVIVAIAPITLRNYWIEGDLILITAHGGMTFYQSNNESATGIYSPIPGAVGNPRHLSATLREIAESERGTSLTMSQVDLYWRDRALQFLVQNPLQSIALVGRKLRFWFGNDEISTEYALTTERALTPSLWLMPIPFALILGLATLGFQSTRRIDSGSDARLLLYGFLLMNICSTALFYFSSRYRLPAVPVLCAFAGFGAIQLVDRITKRQFGGGVWLLPSLTLGIISLYSFTDDYERYAAHQWFNYGLVYDEREMFERSIDSYHHALEGLPDRWQVHYAIARAYGRLEETNQAIHHYQRALELRPQSLDLRRGLEAEQSRLSSRSH